MRKKLHIISAILRNLLLKLRYTIFLIKKCKDIKIYNASFLKIINKNNNLVY